MNKNQIIQLDRRDFIAKVIPACSLLCLGSGSALALTPFKKNPLSLQEKHKFDNEIPMKLTLRDYFKRTSSRTIELLKAFEKKIGEDRLLEILREIAFERGKKQGESVATRNAGRDFHFYNERFRDQETNILLTYEIVEDTDKVFEVKVTECAVSLAYLEAGVGKLANAYLCHEDYGHAVGYNPNIKMVRDKTLALGHNCCNHRYVWTG